MNASTKATVLPLISQILAGASNINIEFPLIQMSSIPLHDSISKLITFFTQFLQYNESKF